MQGSLCRFPLPRPPSSLFVAVVVVAVGTSHGGGGGELMTNVINKNCTAGAHDIFQVKRKRRRKKTLLGTNRFQEIHCWGTCYISEGKKDTVGHVIDSQNTLLGNIILFLIYCWGMSYTKICTSRTCTIQYNNTLLVLRKETE